MTKTSIGINKIPSGILDTAVPFTLFLFCFLALCFARAVPVRAQQDMRSAAGSPDLHGLFTRPPHDAGTWVYWWWLNGYVSKEGILRELDEFRDKGITGALVFQAGSGYTPKKTPFMSEKWRELFKFTVGEAARRGITITLNICEGWNAGGPWVTEEHASMRLQHAILETEGPRILDTLLPALPEKRFARDLFTFAWKTGDGNCLADTYTDLTGCLAADGRINWNVPPGRWMIIRFGKYVHPAGFTKLTNDSAWFTDRWFETNEMDREGMQIHFDNTAKVAINDVRPHAGKTFTHLHIDSGETGHPDWTPGFFDHFERLRDYDPRPFMAAKAGFIFHNDTVTKRFLEDYSRTQGDLITTSYYGRLEELAEGYGMGAHSEAAGYQKPIVDAIRAMGVNDIAMSEFWSRTHDNYIHQATQAQLAYHDGIRNAAAAAHTYGRKIVQAEAFTNMGWMNFSTPLYELKDIGDRAFCQGLNRMVLCFLVHQAECERSLPGYAWPYVGTCFNVNATWWDWSREWFGYLNRCHALLQAGSFTADVCYFQGEWVPSYVPARWRMDPSLPQGFDCDVVNVQVLTGKATVNDKGEMVLPGGTRYRYLVLSQAGPWQMPPGGLFNNPEETPTILEWPDMASGRPLALSPGTLECIAGLVREGLTLVGPPPGRAIGLTGYPESDAKIKSLSASLWGEDPDPSGQRSVGKGRVIWGKNLQEVMDGDGLLPDLEYTEDAVTASLPLPVETPSRIPDPCGFDWIHRQSGDAHYYFVANLRNKPAGGDFLFRQAGRQPELWDPLTGETRYLYEYRFTGDERISVPLKFAPRQSYFIIFRKDPEPYQPGVHPIPNFPPVENLIQLSGDWTVGFDSTLGGPAETVFHGLTDWSSNADERIRYYSGIARYSKEFKLKRKMIKPGSTDRILLDLGRVEVMARVILNGETIDTLWTPPWQLDITGAAQPGWNQLEIELVNLWRNRLIGDRDRPERERITRTNVEVKSDEALFPSGLLGPVVIKKQITEHSFQ